MKIFFILVIMLAFMLIGYLIYDNYKRKKTFYNDILEFCLYLSNEIRFNKNDISKIILASNGRYCSELQSYLDAFINDNTYQEKLLNTSEHLEVIEFFKSLGKFDVDGELKNINKYKELFAKKLNTATKEEKTKGCAIFKIFIILGLLVSIILF